MRTLIALAASVLFAGAALADEPQACYAAKDPSGDFTRDKMVPFDADPALAVEMRQLEGKYQRVTDKCIDRYARREGGLVKGAVVLYGGRISPEGKMTQVSVLGAENVNDAMFMACVARMYTASTSGRSSRSTFTLMKCAFMKSAVAASSKDSCAMTWHQWHAA